MFTSFAFRRHDYRFHATPLLHAPRPHPYVTFGISPVVTVSQTRKQIILALTFAKCFICLPMQGQALYTSCLAEIFVLRNFPNGRRYEI